MTDKQPQYILPLMQRIRQVKPQGRLIYVIFFEQPDEPVSAACARSFPKMKKKPGLSSFRWCECKKLDNPPAFLYNESICGASQARADEQATKQRRWQN